MSARAFRNAVAAVALTAALAVSGTGCGNGEGSAADREPAAEGSSPSRETTGPDRKKPTPETSPKEGESAEQDSGGDAEGPTVPRAELTPATGSFTERQKDYLVDRVPEGYEPAAVLEAGQAACRRIARTAGVDRKAAVSALESGEIAGAKDAVLHLCPRHKPLLRAAGLLG